LEQWPRRQTCERRITAVRRRPCVVALLAAHSPSLPDPRLTAPLTPHRLVSSSSVAARSLRQSTPLPPPPSPALRSPDPWPTATSRAESSRCASRSGRPSPPPPQIYRPVAHSCSVESDTPFPLVINPLRIWICAGDAAAPQRTRCPIAASRDIFSENFGAIWSPMLLFWSRYSCLLFDRSCFCSSRACSARD